MENRFETEIKEQLNYIRKLTRQESTKIEELTTEIEALELEKTDLNSKLETDIDAKTLSTVYKAIQKVENSINELTYFRGVLLGKQAKLSQNKILINELIKANQLVKEEIVDSSRDLRAIEEQIIREREELEQRHKLLREPADERYRKAKMFEMSVQSQIDKVNKSFEMLQGIRLSHCDYKPDFYEIVEAKIEFEKQEDLRRQRDLIESDNTLSIGDYYCRTYGDNANVSYLAKEGFRRV